MSSRSNQISWKHTSGRSPRPSRRGAAAAAAAAVLGGVLVVVVLILAVLRGPGGGEGPPADGESPEAANTASGGRGDGAADANGGGSTDPVDGGVEPVQLPEGSGTVEGYPVGFPRSELGAVAVPVELSRAQIGFDYGQAATAAEVYAAEADRDAVVARASQAVAYRRDDLALPTRGAVPAPASFALTPYAFRPTELQPDRYLVTVLNLASATSKNGKVTTRYYAGTQVVAWTDAPVGGGADWRLVEPTGRDQQQLATLPETQPAAPEDLDQLAAAGWTPIATQTPGQTHGTGGN